VKEVQHEGREVRVLRISQGKTVDIILAGDLEKLVDEHLRESTVWSPFVHTRAGKKYTYSGIAAMFRRYVRKTGLTDFGLYDIKGKGATDMYRAGVPLERIQHLLGHDRVTTTEIYIKARLPDVATPNMREMQG
jgi:site-specific recombinase XerD